MPPVISPPITTTVWRVEVACILCARVSGYVQDARVHANAPEDANDVARLRCPFCGGRLVTHGEAYPVRIFRKLTEQEQRPNKRGRPSKAKAQAIIKSAPRRPSWPLCRDCDERHVQPGRRRCRDCDNEHRRATGIVGRLLELLACSEPLPTRYLAAMIGCNPGSIRQEIRKARARGVPIVTISKRYRLEAAG